LSVQTEQEKFSFQAEVVQLLDLMIHSLYSNREIFLRELISNASDAIDRLRFEALQQPELRDDAGLPRIWVDYDPAARTITVSDNGIGMSRDEVIEHIGTIARSGTREFLYALSGDQQKDAALIGQFGVGFYSSFVVADHVTLTTRRAGLPAGDGVRWESDGRGEYTLEPAERPSPGSDVVLHLREGEDDLLTAYRLRTIIQKYSDHISLPIVMRDEETGDPPDAGGVVGTSGRASSESGDGKSGDGKGGDGKGGDGESQDGEGGSGEAVAEAIVNQASALWARPKGRISQREYHEFYKHVANDYAEPLAYVHSKMEGGYEYTLLLYIPATAPFDLWMAEPRNGVKLHVQRVFITEDPGLLMPGYLRFVRGVIDSADLPLNISREMLQNSRAVDSIRATATRKVLRLLADLAERKPAKYAIFWKQFGAVLKEGIPEDYANREEIASLLRFTSTKSGTDEQEVSLADYVARMAEGQEEIYYLLAPAFGPARNSPHLEMFRKKGIEVLLLADPVDAWVVNALPEFEGMQLKSVAQGALDLGALEDDSDREAAEKAVAEFANLLDRMKTVLGDRVYAVRVTGRLLSSPACLVADEADTGFDLARGQLTSSGLPAQPVLEVNPRHPLVVRLNREPDDRRFADWTHVLYNQAVLTMGSMIEDPAAFTGRLNNLLLALTEEQDSAGQA
jgi:molecular chaperone HtpG